MKGTIFHKGKKLKDKIIRGLAWIRVKKYWLLMPKKEYKTNLFYNITGMIIWLIGIPVAAYCLIVNKVVPYLVKVLDEKEAKKEINS